MSIPDDVLATLADAWEGAPAEVVLRGAVEELGSRVTFATGFGADGCVIIDLIASSGLPIDIFTLDTGVLFPETYELWRRLEQRYAITIRAVRPAQTIEEQAVAHGPALWERDPDRCCEMRKVEPLRAALDGFDAWISAIRRDQTPERAGSRMVERDRKFGLVKVNPIAAWSSADVWDHVWRHDVPTNPLHHRGYPSIGCAPCTTPVAAGEDPRAGRWRGSEKTECGLHKVDGRLVPLGPRLSGNTPTSPPTHVASGDPLQEKIRNGHAG